MNAAHFHLIVNHLPIFAAMFGGLMMAVGLWRRSESPVRAGLMLAVVTEMGNDDRESGERKPDDAHR